MDKSLHYDTMRGRLCGMKSPLILAAAGAALLISACHSTRPAVTRSTAQTRPAVAQPVQPYTQQATPVNQVTGPQTYVPTQQPTAQPVIAAIDPLTGQTVMVQQQPVQPVQPLYTVDPITGQFVQVTPAQPAPQVLPTQDMTAQQQPLAPTMPQQPAPVAGTTANYALQMVNGTTGRLFVEVFDDSDNVFPIGYLFAGQNISTPPSEPRNIQGQLTVVIRDPDADGKELRRYKVTPPMDYTNKTIGVTILPGGRYRASVDGQVYYTSPDPKADAAASSTPAAPAAPAPAPAPAANPATSNAPIL